MIVYLITNKENGKQYVGQTIHSIELRWNQHSSTSRAKRKWLIHKAIKKYGEEKFSIEILHTCESKEEMDFVEMFYITILNTKVPNGYNLSDGGDGPNGHKHSESSRNKIRIARAKQIMQPVTEETRRKMSIGISAAKPWSHGTKTGRVNHRCKCEICLQWSRDRWLKEKAMKPPREKASWNAGTGKGVYQRKNGNWIVLFSVNNKLKSYGTFKTKEEAEQRLAEVRKTNEPRA